MMTRFLISSTLLSVMVLAGCGEPVKDDPRYRVDPAMLKQASTEGFAMADATEVDLVESLARSRNEYVANLQALQRYYAARGNAVKKIWADKELDAIGEMPHYQYLMPGETVLADRRATDSIEEADILYNEAMDLYKEAGGLVFIVDDVKLRMALNKFNQVIAMYPSSDKIDDAAYRAGRIYEHFKDYEIAARYYQQAFQWNEYTPYPARFRAAKVMDRKLLMRNEALTLYRLAVQLESRYEDNTIEAKERILELAEPLPQETADSSAAVGQE